MALLIVTLLAPEVFEISMNIPDVPGPAVSVIGVSPDFGSWHFWLPAIKHEASSLILLNFIFQFQHFEIIVFDLQGDYEN